MTFYILWDNYALLSCVIISLLIGRVRSIPQSNNA